MMNIRVTHYYAPILSYVESDMQQLHHWGAHATIAVVDIDDFIVSPLHHAPV
jgi:hypothetical protein